MKILHDFYMLVGKVYYEFANLYWTIRDRLVKRTESSILFCAHPDDDTLFFYTYIKEHKPYVALMTTGWSFIRLRGFQRAMRAYGVRCRAYDMTSRDENVALIRKRIRHILSLGHFELCVTHNAEGEYGHMMHKQLHNAVLAEADIPVYTSELKDELAKYPLSDEVKAEKIAFINKYYREENWIITEHANWVAHEHLIRVK